ncbi:MAG: hypothetical protein GY859_32965 [Desulfobacterales bacterium]|nr:hypothetical protein [Desulfobacterales bacterium]
MGRSRGVRLGELDLPAVGVTTGGERFDRWRGLLGYGAACLAADGGRTVGSREGVIDHREDEPSAEIAVKASYTTKPAVKALRHRCCCSGCRSRSR